VTNGDENIAFSIWRSRVAMGVEVGLTQSLAFALRNVRDVAI